MWRLPRLLRWTYHSKIGRLSRLLLQRLLGQARYSRLRNRLKPGAQSEAKIAERNRILYLATLVTRARQTGIVSAAAADRLDDIVFALRRNPADR